MQNSIIAVIGSSNVDLIMKMDHLPESGETVTDAEFLQVYGGKGANQAVAAARAGGNVSLINCVGEDAYTPEMVRNYEKDGINTGYVFHERGIASGHALIMIGAGGENYLSVAPGANYRLTPEKIDQALPVVEKAGIIILQYEILPETIKYVLDLAGRYNTPVLWNFAPAREFDLAYLNKVNILVVNEVEAGFLAGIPVKDTRGAEQAARILLQKGVETVVITLGNQGAVMLDRDNQVYVPAYQVDAVDTTSAGDVFCGTYAVALMEGKPPGEALRFACAASALCVTRMGAQPSAPTRAEIEAFISQHEPG
jgi:ribokinase